MEILRVSVVILSCILPHASFQKNCLAQLATVDQQRELMRYMQGLNEWLECDVHDRQFKLRGVVAWVDQLSCDIWGICISLLQELISVLPSHHRGYNIF
jgi:hypothetical protein